MFKISTRGDYGLLLLSALAEQKRKGKKIVSLREIAGAKGLSLPYLSQIILPLKEAGFVESKEGRDGGYSLAREPQSISMMEVLEVLEGPVSPVRCCSDKTKKCGSEQNCGVKTTWQQAKKILTGFLKNRTLEDILHS